ncbi:peptide MFS transporter [Eilatimonas milleporae]|uniref:POT family proton-dependent oligopeptide transporter n=1 Tax=Eilatimonas milleporae TaxID=911205 RepID=A0A3M0CSC1_9PROT|nr:peptide MFS transporter [Eilatimonas milleporae]RMB12504.1 POT family proton-dependent oligopeptide transporter [Eilatimonas milleporae]
MSDTIAGGTRPEAHAGSQEREFLGHPIGLGVLFLTEMWERFSFYGMRALLVLYLTKHFLFSAEGANLIYGAYLGLVYVLPVIGGALADRYLGSRKAVVYGGLLLVAGHISLAFEGPPAIVDGNAVVRSDLHLSIFFLSLALIITGVGFLKANISTIVGSLYGEKDPRRDGGFTIFYMGINVGSLLSIVGVGYVGEVYGWGYGFGMAGIGMLLGLLIFLWGQPLLEGRADPPDPAVLKEKILGGLITREWGIYAFGLVLVLFSWGLMQYQTLIGYVFYGSAALILVVILTYGFTKCTPQERDRVIVAVILMIFMVVFWMLFEQQGSSLTLLADQQFEKSLFGIPMQASQVQSLNPFFIIVLAPVLSWAWQSMSRRNLEPSTPAKFALSLLVIGLGYLFFSFGLTVDEGTNKSMLWMVMIYFMLTMAELLISPVGLSMITKLSTQRIVGMMMGTFFLYIALGNYLSGVLASLTGGGGHGVADSDKLDIPGTVALFSNVGWLSVVIGVGLLVLTPWLRRRMHGIH